MQKDIKQKWFFEHPPEKVWDFLTQPELIRQWLMENDFQPVVGHKFRFNTKPKIKVGFDGMIYCEVLEVEPLRRLSYSWRGGPRKGEITLDSIVTWTLAPKNNGTELTLEHTGFKGMKNYIPYLIMNNGWQGRIKRKLISLLNSYTNETIQH